MKKLALRIGVLLASLAIAFLLAEGAYRLLRREGGGSGEMYFRDAVREAFHPRTDARGEQEKIEYFARFMELVQTPMPRPGVARWRPGSTFYVCYTGPAQPYFDPDGCVRYDINSLGLRDRPGLTYAKPEKVYRVLCLGDSFTLGWGVRREHNWPVLVEGELSTHWPQVQVVNCGGVGTSYADEYWYGLQHRFFRFEPDLVLVTLCLNDLIVTNGKLGHYREGALQDEHQASKSWWQESTILADLARALGGSPLALDPGRDHVGELLALPADHPWYTDKGETPELFWGAGTPQRALTGIRDWCAERGVKLGVVVWPLFQGLAEGDEYPFATLHQMVASFCSEKKIPLLDLVSTFRGQTPEELWVSPVDMHPNERAQLLAYPVIASFVADVAGLQR